MNKATPWQKISETTVLDTGFYRVNQHEVITPQDSKGKYFVIESSPSVFIIPISSDDLITLVRVYRYPTQQWSWEIPAGGCDTSETPQASAQRELWEETGLRCNALECLGTLQLCNGKSDAMGTVFLAKNLVQSEQNQAEVDGIDSQREVSIPDVKKMILSGEITDALTIASLSLYFLKESI